MTIVGGMSCGDGGDEGRDSRLVKAFNSAGNQHMVDPALAGGPPTMFICGDHDGCPARCRDHRRSTKRVAVPSDFAVRRPVRV